MFGDSVNATGSMFADASLRRFDQFPGGSEKLASKTYLELLRHTWLFQPFPGGVTPEECCKRPTLKVAYGYSEPVKYSLSFSYFFMGGMGLHRNVGADEVQADS